MIYFVRHGESELNRHMLSGGDFVFDDHYDAPLTELGREQVAETAEKLKNTNIDVVVTSGLRRAIETGEIINRYHGVPMVAMKGLDERKVLTDATTMEEWGKAFEFGYEADPGIEKLGSFRDRVVQAIKEIREKYGDKDVLVAAHGGVGHVVRRYFSGEPWEGNIRKVFLGNAEVEEFEFGDLGGEK